MIFEVNYKIKSVLCKVDQKKWNTPINFNANDRREIKLVPLNIDYCLLQFDALNFFLGVRVHGRSVHNFNVFSVNPPNLTTKS